MPKAFPVRAALLFFLLIVLSVLVFSTFSHARAQAAAADKPYVIEYYYKTKWGHAEEFITLFRKNHFPVLKKEMEMGRILKVTGTAPVYHTTEDGRWDYRITIVFKNAAIANDGRKVRRLIASCRKLLSERGEAAGGSTHTLR